MLLMPACFAVHASMQHCMFQPSDLLTKEFRIKQSADALLRLCYKTLAWGLLLECAVLSIAT